MQRFGSWGGFQILTERLSTEEKNLISDVFKRRQEESIAQLERSSQRRSALLERMIANSNGIRPTMQLRQSDIKKLELEQKNFLIEPKTQLTQVPVS